MLSQTTSTAAASVSVEQHLGLVKQVAKKIARRLPSVVDVDDLVGAGTIGLMDAATRFDPTRCGTFAPYAEIRIRGAILDHLRAMDWLPRSLRTKNRRMEEETRGTDLTRPLMAAVVSVEDLRDDGFDGFELDGFAPSQPLETRERAERLAAAIDQLPERTRQLLSLYYVEELTLKQIGVIFGLTESRACQLHGQAIAKLRTELADDVDLV